MAAELGDHALPVTADVSDPAAAQAMVVAAVERFGRLELAVNAVCPGSTRTPMLEGFAGGDEANLDRLGTAAEVAEAIVWLCSDTASFVTGHALAVDGGVLAT